MRSLYETNVNGKIAMPTLTMIMGPEEDGLYSFSRLLRNLGLNCGEPTAELLENPDRARTPAPELLWYWKAIRRFYLDMGLPPIAEVPSDMISDLEREYYSALFARSLMQSIKQTSFICADHLSPLVLPLLIKSLEIVEKYGIAWRMYFFYANPARGIAGLLNKREKPVKLAEFVWRNTVTAAIRHAASQIRFVDVDRLNREETIILISEICEFYGCKEKIAQAQPPFIEPWPAVPPSLSPLTWNLYHALQMDGTKEAEKAARTAWEAQTEQNGWQYMDCMEYRLTAKNMFTGEDDACWLQAESASHAMPRPEEILPETAAPPAGEPEQAWLALLDMVERSCINRCNSHAAKLFRYADLVGQDYNGIIENLRSIDANREKGGSDK